VGRAFAPAAHAKIEYRRSARGAYKGLAKNANRIFACFALVNLYLTRKRLAPLRA